MYKRIRQALVIIGVAYFSLHCVSSQLANFALAIFLVLLIPFFIVLHFFLNNMYKHSIRIVSKQFVVNQNTLRNDHCTVIYQADEKIIVMDNIADRSHAKRMFSIDKTKLNVNKAWNRVCRVFDSFITLDSLVSFYSYDTKVDIITLEAKSPPRTVKKKAQKERKYEEPKFVALDNIQADNYNKVKDKANSSDTGYVNLNDIQEQKPFEPTETKAPEFSGLDELMHNSPNKINVNTVTSSELSILPGINIVGAKKIIEYRDMNGYFETVEDFLTVASVKSHFEEKIKNMVTVDIPQEKNDDDDTFEGRIIDF